MKIIVAHPDQQHSYKLASAIDKCGSLYMYVTTVYYTKGSLTYYLSKFLPSASRRKAVNRHSDELAPHKVKQFCEAFALVKLLFQNTPFLRKWYTFMRYSCADRFARRVARYAIKEKVDMVITYDDCSPVLFDILKEKAPEIIRVLDVSAANRLYMKKIYTDDLMLAEPFAEKMKRETPQIWNASYLERNRRELELSEYFLVPSEFVIHSLLFSGISREKIFRCPYGVDTSLFTHKRYEEIDLPIKFVYLGGITEFKGIYYLLEAFKDIPQEEATLSLIGDFGLDSQELEPYKDNCHFLGRVFHNDLPEVLKAYDVFVFPSLGDSFSFACVEAAATGLPLIVTKNTGMQDYISEGEEGFVISIQSVDDIKSKVNWFVDNKDCIVDMGRKSAKMANQLTWDKYNEAIKRFVTQIGILEQRNECNSSIKL